MPTACSNEKQLKETLSSNGETIIKKGYSFSDQESHCITVDGHFVYKNKLYLLEVDSYNMAKVVVGQYVLLNLLYDENVTQRPKSECIFLVVHFYKGYNIARTEKYLDYMNDEVFQHNGMPYKVLHITDFDNLASFYDLL